MSDAHVGTVKALYRYPVKSMQGERLPAVGLGPLGMEGDRVFALRESGGRILSAKRTKELLGYSATWRADAPGQADSVVITTPEGEMISAEGPTAAASARLTELLGRDVTLEVRGSSGECYGELDADTIFDGIPIAEALAGKKRQLPADADRYGLAAGTFFDSAHLHLLTTGTIAHLQSLVDDDVNLDIRRFRPNVLIETRPEIAGFVEDEWVGGRLRIGDAVEITEVWPTLRCVMTTVSQADVPKDPRVLKTIVREHETNLGVFAAVDRAGVVSVGDAVRLVS